MLTTPGITESLISTGRRISPVRELTIEASILSAVLADVASYAGGGYGNRNRMPSYAMLPAEDLGHIAAFLEAQK